MASKYISRVAIDDDTTIPDDPFVDGVSTGHNGHHTNIGGAIRAAETFLGIVGTSPTTAPPGGGTVLVSTSSGQSDWAAPPAGTLGSTVAYLDPTTASTAGSATSVSKSDHKHLWMPIFEVSWTVDTVTSPLTVPYVFSVNQASTLLDFRLDLDTAASTGSNTKADLLVGGTTRLSTQPEIPVGQTQNTIAPVFTSTALASRARLKVAITQGSSGGPLTLTVTYRWELT